ncbi:MAG: LysR substrate-binding domain-containing protein [Fluviibacter sp.]|jgi:LysR family transcriptional regulator, glycine cleavage system transcriptional activator|nr:LysR family transcriptional regulator [Rhodocyclales bacterium]
MAIIPRVPNIQGLLAFEALARHRNVTQVADELHITPSAISHRIRQIETQLKFKLFVRKDFSLTPEGEAYLKRVREALAILQVAEPAATQDARTQLRIAVTPTFSRQILMPRLPLFRYAYPEIDLVLQVSIPLFNVVSQETDLEVRFGVGPFADRESVHLLSDHATPVCSPNYLNEVGSLGGFDNEEQVARALLIHSELEPWETWFDSCKLDKTRLQTTAKFNDLGMLYDASAAGLGVCLARTTLGAAWLETGRLVRLSDRTVAAPNHHYLSWKPGVSERWECAAFIEWLVNSLGQTAE